VGFGETSPPQDLLFLAYYGGGAAVVCEKTRIPEGLAALHTSCSVGDSAILI